MRPTARSRSRPNLTDTFSFKLPATVEDGQAEAIADVFHMVWACGAREPSQAAKAWLEKH